MLYRQMGKTGDMVSALGYGCLRFPRKNGRVDEERTERQIVSAVERGVNYFDTAYIYTGNEAILGRILERTGLRDRVYIATKMPTFLIHSRQDMENTLQTSLDRLRTGRIDYYLIHSLMSLNGWQRLCELGVEEFLAQQRETGRIVRVGFSYHGDKTQFPLLVDAYPWDFCQIQYNYLDEHFQAGTEGLQYASAKGLGVISMEPLRGGLLGANAPDAVRAVWDRADVKRSPAEWGLRWVWNHREISTLLCGMNEEAHIGENIRAASDALPGAMTGAELALADEAKAVYQKLIKVGCTGCGYCLPCPAGVNIPQCFTYYNDFHFFRKHLFKTKYLTSSIGTFGSDPSYASLCRDCGKCEKHCPQGLPIRRHLGEVAKEMEPFYLKPVSRLVRGYYGMRKRNRIKAKD